MAGMKQNKKWQDEIQIVKTFYQRLFLIINTKKLFTFYCKYFVLRYELNLSSKTEDE